MIQPLHLIRTFILLPSIIIMKRFLLFSLFSLSLNVALAQFDSTAVQASTTVDSINDKEFTAVQVEAQFPGGLPAWRNYVAGDLNVNVVDSCPALTKNQKSVRQTVMVSFRVDRGGNISDVKAENEKGICPLIILESIRVIKEGPRWIPATQNGKKVIYRQKQPITWVISEE